MLSYRLLYKDTWAFSFYLLYTSPLTYALARDSILGYISISFCLIPLTHKIIYMKLYIFLFINFRQ